MNLILKCMPVALLFLTIGCVDKKSNPETATAAFKVQPVDSASQVFSKSSQNQIGVFNGAKGEQIPLYALVTMVQANGELLLPRGDNFAKGSYVEMFSQYSNLLDLLGQNETSHGGLFQPDINSLNIPYDREVKWVVDHSAGVVGYGFYKRGLEKPNYLYNSESEARHALVNGIGRDESNPVLAAPSMKQVGVFVGQYPVYSIVTIVQGTGDFLIPRGDNFIKSSFVSLDEKYRSITDLLGFNETGHGGLLQPDLNTLNIPYDRELKWIADLEYKVTGYGLLRKGASKPQNVYDTQQQAQAAIDQSGNNGGRIDAGNGGGGSTGGSGGGGVTSGQSCAGIVNTDWNIGRIGYKYGSSFDAYAAEMPGGESIFRFYGNEQVNYPAPAQNQDEANRTPSSIGDFRQLYLLSHSVTSDQKVMNDGVISKIHYKLWDQSGKLVAEVCDTKGGFHPAGRPNQRGNNHTDDTNRWIKKGVYKIWYKNISDNPKAIQQFEWYKGDIDYSGQGQITHRQYVQPGQEIEFTMDMNDNARFYKLNGNIIPGTPGL